METPKIQMLLFRLASLSADLTHHLQTLQKHFSTNEDILVLSAAPHNIVDRQKEKERNKKRWKVELKEIVDTGLTGVEYESLDVYND